MNAVEESIMVHLEVAGSGIVLARGEPVTTLEKLQTRARALLAERGVECHSVHLARADRLQPLRAVDSDGRTDLQHGEQVAVMPIHRSLATTSARVPSAFNWCATSQYVFHPCSSKVLVYDTRDLREPVAILTVSDGHHVFGACATQTHSRGAVVAVYVQGLQHSEFYCFQLPSGQLLPTGKMSLSQRFGRSVDMFWDGDWLHVRDQFLRLHVFDTSGNAPPETRHLTGPNDAHIADFTARNSRPTRAVLRDKRQYTLELHDVRTGEVVAARTFNDVRRCRGRPAECVVCRTSLTLLVWSRQRRDYYFVDLRTLRVRGRGFKPAADGLKALSVVGDLALVVLKPRLATLSSCCIVVWDLRTGRGYQQARPLALQHRSGVHTIHGAQLAASGLSAVVFVRTFAATLPLQFHTCLSPLSVLCTEAGPAKKRRAPKSLYDPPSYGDFDKKTPKHQNTGDTKSDIRRADHKDEQKTRTAKQRAKKGFRELHRMKEKKKKCTERRSPYVYASLW